MQKSTSQQFNRKEMAELFNDWFLSKGKKPSEKELKLYCDLAEKDFKSYRSTMDDFRDAIDKLIREENFIAYSTFFEKLYVSTGG